MRGAPAVRPKYSTLIEMLDAAARRIARADLKRRSAAA